MMRALYNVFLFLSLGLIIVSCDKVDDPFPKDLGKSFQLNDSTEYIADPSFGFNSGSDLETFINNNSWDSIVAPSNRNTRFILLEEFTGHTCIFCPEGTREILRLDSIYKEQLIPVSIHAGNFAQPNPPQVGKYTTDFRVIQNGKDHGQILQNTFNVAGYPSGIVNRKNGNVSTKDNWATDIASYKDDTPQAEIKLKNYYSDAQKTIRLQIDIEWLATLSDNFKLSVFLVEDHIIDWQKDGQREIQNYDHRHVLRKVVNDTFGKDLKAAENGKVESIQYITKIEPDWKPQDMEAIVFIFNSDQNSYEVIQANASYFP